MPTNPDNQGCRKFSWIDLSPDCKFAFAGHGSYYGPMKNGVLGGRFPWTPLAEFKEPEDWVIEDVAWSADSQFLVVLEGRQRFSNSPLGILGRSMGHGIPLMTFFVTTVNTTTGIKRRTEIVKDVRYGTAYVYGAESKCPREKRPGPVFGEREPRTGGTKK
jgi:hypothetical protein